MGSSWLTKIPFRRGLMKNIGGEGGAGGGGGGGGFVVAFVTGVRFPPMFICNVLPDPPPPWCWYLLSWCKYWPLSPVYRPSLPPRYLNNSKTNYTLNLSVWYLLIEITFTFHHHQMICTFHLPVHKPMPNQQIQSKVFSLLAKPSCTILNWNKWKENNNDWMWWMLKNKKKVETKKSNTLENYLIFTIIKRYVNVRLVTLFTDDCNRTKKNSHFICEVCKQM